MAGKSSGLLEKERKETTTRIGARSRAQASSRGVNCQRPTGETAQLRHEKKPGTRSEFVKHKEVEGQSGKVTAAADSSPINEEVRVSLAKEKRIKKKLNGRGATLRK